MVDEGKLCHPQTEGEVMPSPNGRGNYSPDKQSVATTCRSVMCNVLYNAHGGDCTVLQATKNEQLLESCSSSLGGALHTWSAEVHPLAETSRNSAAAHPWMPAAQYGRSHQHGSIHVGHGVIFLSWAK